MAAERAYAELMMDDPIARYVLTLLNLAEQDRASELLISASDAAGSAIRYKVAGTWHALSPPPPHVLTGLRTELGRLADFREAAFPKEGLIDAPLSGVRLRWRVRVAAADADYVLTPA